MTLCSMMPYTCMLERNLSLDVSKALIFSVLEMALFIYLFLKAEFKLYAAGHVQYYHLCEL